MTTVIPSQSDSWLWQVLPGMTSPAPQNALLADDDGVVLQEPPVVEVQQLPAVLVDWDGMNIDGARDGRLRRRSRGLGRCGGGCAGAGVVGRAGRLSGHLRLRRPLLVVRELLELALVW